MDWQTNDSAGIARVTKGRESSKKTSFLWSQGSITRLRERCDALMPSVRVHVMRKLSCLSGYNWPLDLADAAITVTAFCGSASACELHLASAQQSLCTERITFQGLGRLMSHPSR